MPAEIRAALPETHMDRFNQMRSLIFAAAEATGTLPLTETLKWGQPAYLPAKRAGTTLRLGVEADRPALFVHCQTDLVSRCRTMFPQEFQYSGNRAVLLPASDPFPEAAFQHIAAMALTYHKEKAR